MRRIGAAVPDGREPASIARLGFDFVQVSYRASLRREWPAELVLLEHIDENTERLVRATLPENTRYGVQAPLVTSASDLERLRRLAQIAGSHGRRVLIENHAESPLEWRAVLAALRADVVGVCLDLGNAHAAGAAHVPPAVGEGALAFLRETDRIAAVHLHDSDPVSGRRHLPLGQGSLELATLASALRDCGIDAPLVLEVDGTHEELAQALALTRELFSAVS